MNSNSPETVQPTTAVSYQYIPNKIRTNLVIYSFSLFAIMSAITTIIGMNFLHVLNKFRQQETSDTQIDLVNTGSLYDNFTVYTSVVFLVCAIFFLCWIYRANSNVHALNPQTRFEYTPAWSVGSYFIPLLSLYWPYQCMKEMWLTVSSDKNVTIVVVWWFAFIIMNILATAVSKMQLHGASEVQLYVILSSISDILGIIAVFAILKIVKKIEDTHAGLMSKNVRGR